MKKISKVLENFLAFCSNKELFIIILYIIRYIFNIKILLINIYLTENLTQLNPTIKIR